MVNTEPFVIVREYSDRDRSQRDEIIRNSYYMANIWPFFLSAVFKEATFQLIVATSAVMFIFFNVSFTFCFLSIPIVATITYFVIYIAQWTKMNEIIENPKAIKIFVAEAYEAGYTLNRNNVNYRIVKFNEPIDSNATKFRRLIVGSISIDKHKVQPHSAWIHTLVVDSRYQRRKIATELISAAEQYSKSERFDTIECSVTECQNAASSLLIKSDFHIIQMYHKKICVIGKIEKYHFGRQISSKLPL